jgi:hypothetical protein
MREKKNKKLSTYPLPRIGIAETGCLPISGKCRVPQEVCSTVELGPGFVARIFTSVNLGLSRNLQLDLCEVHGAG